MTVSEIIENTEVPCTTKIPEFIIKLIDKLVTEGKYESRSSLIRLSIRKLLIDEGTLNILPEHELDSYQKSKLKQSHIDFIIGSGQADE